jgi:hypothetical protein
MAAPRLQKKFKDGSGVMVVHRGLVHRYLGMTIDYSTRSGLNLDGGLCEGHSDDLGQSI